MADATRYTIKDVRKELDYLHSLHPNTTLKDWGIEVRDNQPARIWAHFLGLDGLLQRAYTIL